MASKAVPCLGEDRVLAQDAIRRGHYSHSVPSGKSQYFKYEDAIVCFSIPANNNISSYLLGEKNRVWELSRLWAPDGHRPNLLTEAISASAGAFKELFREVEAIVSYADPNVGHKGGVYRAASWMYAGQSEEGRYYRNQEGQVVSRRKFHSGKNFIRKADIEALGYVELKLPGKHRFVKGLSKRARKILAKKLQEYRP